MHFIRGVLGRILICLGHHTFRAHWFCSSCKMWEKYSDSKFQEKIYIERKAQWVLVGLKRLKGIEHQVKNPKTTKELWRDNVSHAPVKEKTSMKEWTTAKKVQSRSQERYGPMERKDGKLCQLSRVCRISLHTATRIGQASMRSSIGWVDPVPLSRGTLYFHSYIQHYKNQQSCPSWAKSNPLKWKALDVISVFPL